MIRQLYSGAMVCVQPFLRRKLRRRGVAEPGYMHAVGERFGEYEADAHAQPGAVWIHAVSLGETPTVWRAAHVARLARWPGSERREDRFPACYRDIGG